MLALVALVLAVQVLLAGRPAPRPLPPPGPQVVLVGVPDLASLPPEELALPWATGRPVAAAAVSEPAPARRGCPLDVWATLGAGRPTSVGTCTVAVSQGRVLGWAALTSASASARPDARLGTLAGAVPGCVAAVGPDAALAAARPDGSVAEHTSFDAFLRAGSRTRCPLTLVDPGTTPPSALAPLLRRPGTTVLLLGVRSRPSAQAVEALVRVGDGTSGWLTSSSTRRTGLVTLPDVTRTLVQAGGGDAQVALPVDGALLAVRPVTLTAPEVAREIGVLQAEPDALLTAAGVLAGLVVLGSAAFLLARRRGHAHLADLLLGAALVLPVALGLTGLGPWPRVRAPAAALVAEALAWTVLLGLVVRRWARRTGLPGAVVACGATLLVLTVDAATGGLLQRATPLDLRPLDGGRWYGFGNTTFAVYAEAVLVVVGWLAGRGAVLAATVLAGLALACEASPTTGADLGGVLALAPPLLWLLLRSRLASVGPLRLVAVAAAALGLGALAAVLDWLRGPQHRTHLGGFVQDLLDGGAGAVLARKADAVVAGAVGPAGLLILGLAALCWWLVLRLRHRAAVVFPSLPRVVAAVAATAVLGTLANDSGVVVGGVLSVLLALTVTGLAHDAGRPGTPARPTLPPGRRGSADGSRTAEPGRQIV